MDPYKEELHDVKKELGLIEQHMKELIQRRKTLQARKKEIENLLEEESQCGHRNNVDGDVDWNAKDFPWSNKVTEAMQSIFKIDKFRPLQLMTINATMSGKDCILIMPTGGGKSLCFQLPAVVSQGVTLVVSPLVSLMEDQLISLKALGINAALLNASSSKEEVKTVHEAMTNKTSDLKMLYVTPEKISKSKRFMAKVEKMYEMGRLSRIAIDEVHCCSQWGHDFRPDYKILGILKRQFPGTPIIGLTATATTKVLDSVKQILDIPDCLLFQASFNRANLNYEVKAKLSNASAMMNELQQVIRTRFRGQSGIIYCFSRKETEDVCRELQTRGIKAGCYHGDMDARQRSYVHRKWLQNEIHVVVATIAFGMGIDKPDVRFVIHHSISKSMENYYQESGRAGRDDKPADVILYFRFQDMFRQSTMVFTEQTGLENLYRMMAYCIDCNKCRRTMIARHFGERWDSAKCNKMCDHCRSKGSVGVESRDMSSTCKTILEILEMSTLKSQNMTGQKLVDSVMSKLKKTSISREDVEKVVIKMLLDGYLREYFHFTPYSTISYIVPGGLAKMLTTSSTQVMVEFIVPIQKNNKVAYESRTPSQNHKVDSEFQVPSAKHKVKNRPKSVSAAKGSQDSNSTGKAPKPKLSIVNQKASKFASTLITIDEDSDEEGLISSQSLTKKSPEKQSVKRKSYDLTGDDELDGFDFGDETKLKPCKVGRKENPGSSKKRKAESSECKQDSACTLKSCTNDQPEHSPAKLQKLDTSLASTASDKLGKISSECTNHSDFDNVDGKLKIQCCITIKEGDNDELDGIGEDVAELTESEKSKAEVGTSEKKKKAKRKKEKRVRERSAKKVREKNGQRYHSLGRGQAYVTDTVEPGAQSLNSGELASCVGSDQAVLGSSNPSSSSAMGSCDPGSERSVTGSDVSSEMNFLTTVTSSVCSDGVHCGEDSDSDDSRKISGRYSPKKHSQTSGVKMKAGSGGDSFEGHSGGGDTGIGSKFQSKKNLSSKRTSFGDVAHSKSDEGQGAESKSFDPRGTGKNSAARKHRRVMVAVKEKTADMPEMTAMGEKESKKLSTRVSSPAKKKSRQVESAPSPKKVEAGFFSKSEDHVSSHSDSARERRRQRLSLKKSLETPAPPRGKERSEGEKTLGSTLESLDGTKSKSIVRGVFNKLRQGRGHSDENLALVSQESADPSSSGEGAVSKQSCSEFVRPKARLSKSLKLSTKFSLPESRKIEMNMTSAPQKDSEEASVLPKQSHDFLSKSYAFGQVGDEGEFRSWNLKKSDSSTTSSTTSDTTPSYAKISEDSLKSVKSLESEDDFEETIQRQSESKTSPKTRSPEQRTGGDLATCHLTASASQVDINLCTGGSLAETASTATSSSVEMSDLYNIYAKQLDTLDDENFSFGDEEGSPREQLNVSKRRKKLSPLRTLTRTVEKCAIHEQDSDDSVTSTGSIEKSMYNLEKLPAVPASPSKRKETSDSEGDLEELCDVYVDQLLHLK